MDNKNELTTTQIAILLDTTNKYIPGKKKFRLQSVIGLQENSTSINTESVSKSNILNKDTSGLPINTLKTSDVIELEIPKEVSTKFIPPGTRFIVSFTSGDITKPTIVGREF